MNIADLTYNYTNAWIALAVAIGAAIVFAGLLKVGTHLCGDDCQEHDGLAVAMTVAFTIAFFAVIFAAATTDRPPLAKTSNQAVIEFMDTTYGLKLSPTEANDAAKDIRRERTTEVRVVASTQGVRLVTFDDRFGQLRAYVHGTNNELPRLAQD